MTRYELAGHLCRQMQIKRLERIGERGPYESKGNPLDGLTDLEKCNWLDLADVVTFITEESGQHAQALRSLADDWERYGYILSRDLEHRDSMRRAVVVEIRALLEQMQKECGWP